jgi:hypothetical protein
LGVVLLIIDALRERQRREAGAPTKESGPAEEPADYPAEAVDDDESSAPAADSEADAEAAESVSDEHNTH